MITQRNSQGDVLKEKGRVKISIRRIDPTDNETHPKTPKVEVIILKQQDSQSPVLPEKITENKIEDENPKEYEGDSETNFLFEEWKFIPDFNQKEFLRQLDPRDLRSLQRTRTWLLSIPLDVTGDDIVNFDSHHNVQYNEWLSFHLLFTSFLVERKVKYSLQKYVLQIYQKVLVFFFIATWMC